VKALVLAAGRGNRMEAFLDGKNKCLLQVHGKALIEYSLDAAATIDEINEIVIIVGYQAESIINQYGIVYNRKRVSYRMQYEQKGLVHALEMAKPNLHQEDFVLFLGDEIVLNGKYGEMIKAFYSDDIYVLCGVVRQPDASQIRKTYAVIQNDANQVFRLIEKPEKPINNIMGTGSCIFKYEMLDYIPKVPLHHIRKEKELPDLIQCAVDDGKLVKSSFFCDYYINVNTKEELIRIEEHWPL